MRPTSVRPARPLDLTLQCALGRSEKAKKEPDRIVKEFCELYEQDEEARTLIDLALSLESLTRNVGKHAGGVVIGPRPLTEFAPLYCEPGGAGVVTQYDKDDVEAVGLVKFDFLGLRTLTIIDKGLVIINRVRAERGEPPLDVSAKWLGRHVAYTSAKLVMAMCTRGMAEEFRDDGIAFNSL